MQLSVYRIIRPDELDDIKLKIGIYAKCSPCPGAGKCCTRTIAGHVSAGSKTTSRFISAATTLQYALSNARKYRDEEEKVKYIIEINEDRRKLYDVSDTLSYEIFKDKSPIDLLREQNEKKVLNKKPIQKDKIDSLLQQSEAGSSMASRFAKSSREILLIDHVPMENIKKVYQVIFLNVEQNKALIEYIKNQYKNDKIQITNTLYYQIDDYLFYDDINKVLVRDVSEKINNKKILEMDIVKILTQLWNIFEYYEFEKPPIVMESPSLKKRSKEEFEPEPVSKRSRLSEEKPKPIVMESPSLKKRSREEFEEQPKSQPVSKKPRLSEEKPKPIVIATEEEIVPKPKPTPKLLKTKPVEKTIVPKIRPIIVPRPPQLKIEEIRKPIFVPEPEQLTMEVIRKAKRVNDSDIEDGVSSDKGSKKKSNKKKSNKKKSNKKKSNKKKSNKKKSNKRR